MATIGVLCPPVPGHLNPHNSLARALLSRGHRVVHINLADAAGRVAAAGLPLRVIAREAFPEGELDRRMKELGQLTGLPQLRYTLDLAGEVADLLFEELAPALEAEGIELAIVDEAFPGAGSTCAALGIPWVTVAVALSWRPDPRLPPPFTPWGPDRGLLSRLRNRLAWGLVDFLLAWPLRRLNAYRRGHGLPPARSVWSECSPWLHLHVLPELLAFPRSPEPPRLHVGPLVDPGARAAVDFDWQRLDGRPLVYVSLGTLQNQVPETFRRICEAALGLDCQLLVSFGGGGRPEGLGVLPGEPWEVPFAPQLEVLQRAALFVSHAGMNSAVESLAAGVPLVMLPVGNDQPGVAARVHAAGAGISLRSSKVSVARIRQALEAVLGDPAYAERARELARELGRLDPLAAACEAVEGVLRAAAPQVPERMASSTQPAEASGKASQ